MITRNLFLTISFFVLISLAYGCANIEPQRQAINLNNPQEAIVALNQALARNPDNKQLKADVGWLYIQTGETKQGVALLIQAPLEPSYQSDYFFPSAKSPDQRREYYLETLKVFDENLNGTTLILGHIFSHHLSKEKIVDPVLITTLEVMVKEKSSPVFFDALVELYPDDINGWSNAVKSSEAAISQIEKVNYNIQDKEHLSHFYFNAACGYSRLGQYDRSLARLKQAFSIDPSLMSWSFQDPDFENLRNHMGYENFKNEMLNLLKGEPASAARLLKNS